MSGESIQPTDIQRREVRTVLDWVIEWYYKTVSLQEMRDKLGRLESLGVTHIAFDYEADYGEFNCNFKALQIRPETDEEFESRKQRYLETLADEKRRQEILDRNNYLRLKKKYED